MNISAKYDELGHVVVIIDDIVHNLSEEEAGAQAFLAEYKLK